MCEEGHPRDKLSMTNSTIQPPPCSISGWIEVKSPSYSLSNRDSFVLSIFHLSRNVLRR